LRVDIIFFSVHIHPQVNHPCILRSSFLLASKHNIPPRHTELRAATVSIIQYDPLNLTQIPGSIVSSCRIRTKAPA
jgi:hypothetical protein